MTEPYIPTTEDVRFEYAEWGGEDSYRERRTGDFDRWLAAHDSEVRAQADAEVETFREQYIPRLTAAETELAQLRAGVVAEEPEWEYGWRSMWANGEEYEWQALPSREAAEEAIRIHQDFEDNSDQIGGRLEFTLWKRTKSQAGPWVPVK